MGCSSCGKRRRKYARPQAAAKQITETIPTIPPPVSGKPQSEVRTKPPETQENAIPTPTEKKKRNFRQIPKNKENK